MNYLTDLNERQREALLYTKGPLLILAGAGSGKTKVVTSKIAYLVKDLGVDPYNILAITFTNKAALEMQERAARLIGSDLNMWIGTFHSICVRILRRFAKELGYTSNFTIYDTLDSRSLIKDIISDFNLSPKIYSDRGIQAKISNLKNTMIGPGEFLKTSRESIYDYEIAKVYEEYEKRLKQNNAFDFDNLIIKTVELLEKNEQVREFYNRRFSYVFVDEYQDTNASQYKFIKLISGKNPNITAVGDSDQSIYKWRGADINNILNFEKDFENAKIILLEQNYRSSKKILNAANRIIKNNKQRLEKNLWTDLSEGKDVVYHNYDHSYTEEKEVINTIIQQNYKGRSLEDMAILYRTNAQSRGFEDQLIRNGISYKVVGGLKFYDRKEVKDIFHYLRMVINPKDDVSFKRVVNEPKRGIGETSLKKLEDFCADENISLYEGISSMDANLLPKKAASSLGEFKKMIEDFAEQIGKKSIPEIMEEVAVKSGYMASLKMENSPTARSRIENIEEMISAAKLFEDQNPDKDLEDFMQEMSLLSDVDKESSDRGVTLMTIHAAKGLEFPVVFLVGLEEGLFPSSMSIEEEGGVEEERRLCYVAITRAKEELYISSAEHRTKFGKTMPSLVSRFIKELGDTIEVKTQNKARVNTQEEFKPSSKMHHSSYVKAKSISRKDVSSTSENFLPGDKVVHKKWGEGMVVMRREKDGDYELTVSFKDKGLKRLKESVAPLERI